MTLLLNFITALAAIFGTIYLAKFLLEANDGRKLNEYSIDYSESVSRGARYAIVALICAAWLIARAVS